MTNIYLEVSRYVRWIWVYYQRQNILEAGVACASEKQFSLVV
jgi:hypothetical protein